VYIDEDGLRDLENRLVGAVQNEKWIRANRSKLGLVPNEDPAISFAANRGPEKNVFYVPVEFGSYWHDDRFGVYVLAPHSEHSSGPHGTTQFRMPNADVSELLLLIRKGRAWLEEDPPDVDSVAETLER
jgi:hypothetical protein